LFLSYAYHRNLTSFPTRRSSDLYLDTVNSKGNGSNIANENYARELLELFTYGVDNGYDQNDITVMSRTWTGWSVNIVDYTNEFKDRKSTRLNSSHVSISYAVFCL